MSGLMTEKQKRKAVYALNLVTVSVSQITSYRDLIIMKQEYDAILNNINLQNIIHDQELLDILKHILDVITFFQIQDKEKEFIDREYQQKMKNAIWSAVPNIGMILSGPLNWGMAITMAVQVGAGYMNYRKEKANTSLEKDRKLWELERSAIEQLNGLRRELFNCAWKLSDKYNFDDSLRLTEKQIDSYNKILLDKDPVRRYERLDVIKNDYQAYAPFWYNLGHAAKEVADNCFNESYRENSGWIDDDDKRIYEKYSKIALENFKTFNKNYISLLREDVIYSSCALEQIPLLMLEDENSKQIPELLKNAAKYAGDNFDLLQQIVLNDLRFEDKIEESQNILRRLVNEDYNTSVNAQILSGLYIKQNKKEEYDLLTHRIDEHIDPSYLIPWPVSKEMVNEEYYSNQRKNLSRQIESFFDKFRVETTLTALKYFPFGECFDEYFAKKPTEEKKRCFIRNARIFGINQINYMELFYLHVSMWNNIFEKFSRIQFINEKYSSVQSLANDLMESYFKPMFELLKELNREIQNNNSRLSEERLEKYFDYLNLINTENNAAKLLCMIQYGLNEVIEQTGNYSLGIYTQRVSELFSAFNWVVPYYFPSKKKLAEEDNSFISMRKIGKETEHQKEIIDIANNVKTQLEEYLSKISFEPGCKKFTTPKELYDFNNQNPLFKKEGINVLAAITTKKGFNFAFDTYSLYFFKNGYFGFCAEYLYNDLNTSEENGKLEIKANIENILIGIPNCKPYITSKDVNLNEFRDLIESLSLNIYQK